jgi:hypothetical protein
MEEMGFQSFDAWANTFAIRRAGVDAEVVSGDGFKASEPHEHVRQHARAAQAVRSGGRHGDDGRHQEGVQGRKRRQGIPAAAGQDGPRQPVSLEKSAAQTPTWRRSPRARQGLEARKGPPRKGEDNALVIMTDARKAAMDIRLVDPDITEREPGGRIDRAADEDRGALPAVAPRQGHAAGVLRPGHAEEARQDRAEGV